MKKTNNEKCVEDRPTKNCRFIRIILKISRDQTEGLKIYKKFLIKLPAF